MGWAAAQHARALVVVDAIAQGDPVDDAGIWIDGPEGHHLQRVRRLTVDESIVVADGSGLWYPGRIVETRAGAVMVARVGSDQSEPVLQPKLTVAFAPAKRDHGTEVAHQLVEIGVDRIIPLITHRSVVRWDADREVKALERLRRVAREASQQCHRARMPVVDPPVEITDLEDSAGILIGDSEGIAASEISVPGDGENNGEWVVVVGPEGGLTAAEVAHLAQATRIRVGHHVLRSVTAPIAIAAALAAHRGH